MANANENDKKSMFKERFRELVGDTATQEEIATKANTSRQNVGNWLNGKSKPDIYALAEIAKGYKVSTDWLLGLTDIKTSDTTIQDICEYTGLDEITIEHFSALKNSQYDYLLKVISFLTLQNKLANDGDITQQNLLDLMWQYIFAKIEIPTFSLTTDVSDFEDSDFDEAAKKMISGEACDIFIYRIKEMGMAKVCTADTLKNVILLEIQDLLKSSVSSAPAIIDLNDIMRVNKNK